MADHLKDLKVLLITNEILICEKFSNQLKLIFI